MLTSVKTRLRKSKEYLAKHQLPLACTVSAAAASAITWRVAGDVMNREFQARGQALLLREVLLRDFVATKGLKEEFLTEFIPSLA